MGDKVTFRGVDLLEMGVNGASWWMDPGGPPTVQAIEKAAPLGTGYWLKEGNKETTDHLVTLVWKSTVGTVRDILASVNSIAVGDLVVPDHGTFSKCRLVSWTPFEKPQKTNGDLYLITSELLFREYP